MNNQQMIFKYHLIALIALLLVACGDSDFVPPDDVQAAISQVDFGDDDGDWARDGECDDPRFEGPGMTNTPLLQEDVMHDATDCRRAFEAGRLRLRGQSAAIAAATADNAAPVVPGEINFGDDEGDWANDGECDDMRFEGAGMTSTPLLDEDVMHDATDCRTAYEDGRLRLRGASGTSAEATPFVGDPGAVDGIDFGDDSGDWSNDGECDDPRFEGPGMTNTPLLDEDRMRDASDCREAFEAGALRLRSGEEARPERPEPIADLIIDGINFGTDGGDYTNDGECDDPRFQGLGMTSTELLVEDIRNDASDCAAAYEQGNLTRRGANNDGSDVQFGRDRGEYANDDECDDPRFSGPGMAGSTVASNIGYDATDCKAAFDAGDVELIL